MGSDARSGFCDGLAFELRQRLTAYVERRAYQRKPCLQRGPGNPGCVADDSLIAALPSLASRLQYPVQNGLNVSRIQVLRTRYAGPKPPSSQSDERSCNGTCLPPRYGQPP
jgi:hypothetical protein